MSVKVLRLWETLSNKCKSRGEKFRVVLKNKIGGSKRNLVIYQREQGFNIIALDFTLQYDPLGKLHII